MNYLDGDGHLVQEASKRSKGGEWRFASGRMSTSGLVSPIYGFFETRMSTLPTEGMLSAWWMWGENGNYDYSARSDKDRSSNFHKSGIPGPHSTVIMFLGGKAMKPIKKSMKVRT